MSAVMEKEKFITSEIKFLEDNNLMSSLNLVTLRTHIREHLTEAIDQSLEEFEKVIDEEIDKWNDEVFGMEDNEWTTEELKKDMRLRLGGK